VTATTGNEIDSVILQIKGLVYVRALLEARGIGEAELAEYRAELARQRRRLAELVGDPSGVPVD
jgi:hypothetical protein